MQPFFSSNVISQKVHSNIPSSGQFSGGPIRSIAFEGSRMGFSAHPSPITYWYCPINDERLRHTSVPHSDTKESPMLAKSQATTLQTMPGQYPITPQLFYTMPCKLLRVKLTRRLQRIESVLDHLHFCTPSPANGRRQQILSPVGQD